MRTGFGLLQILMLSAMISACGNSPEDSGLALSSGNLTEAGIEMGQESTQVESVQSESTQSESAQSENSQSENAQMDSGADSEENNNIADEEENTMLQMKIGDTDVSVAWESNESVGALKELCANGPLEIQMSMYGGFEQVGSIGQSLPREDEQTTADSGDIVLYSGNQIVVFYGSNSWAYTCLGHITDKTSAEMKELLGNGDVTIAISQ